MVWIRRLGCTIGLTLLLCACGACDRKDRSPDESNREQVPSDSGMRPETFELVYPQDAPPPPEGMVLVPGARYRMGAGPKTVALLKRTRSALLDKIRRDLRNAEKLAELAALEDTDELRDALVAREEELASVIAQAEQAEKLQRRKRPRAGGLQKFLAGQDESPHPDRQHVAWIRTRAGNLQAAVAEATARSLAFKHSLAVLKLARARLAIAQAMPDLLTDEQPPAWIEVPAFYMDATEVTRVDFQEFCRATGRRMTGYAAVVSGEEQPHYMHTETADPSFIDPNCPVTDVNWYDARDYATWAGKRLPSEVEWELAARAGTYAPLPWGSKPFDGTQANLGGKRLLAMCASYQHLAGVTADDGFVCLAQVRAFPPNRLGIYGLAGNVEEWCQGTPYYKEYMLDALAGRLPEDWQEPDPNQPLRYGKPRQQDQPVRGGSYVSTQFGARCSRRFGDYVAHRGPQRGFRCAMDIDTWRKIRDDR
jgi:formylglycine-generating enzyme required for sulfatase activity